MLCSAGTYTDLLPTHGYLTDKRTLNMPAFEAYVRILSSHEPIVFEKKRLRAAGGGGGGGRYSRRDVRGRGSAAASVASSSDPLAYKREYYLQKTGLHPKDAEGRQALVRSYLEGLCWCLAYYHDGCASWDWCANTTSALRPLPHARTDAPPFEYVPTAGIFRTFTPRLQQIWCRSHPMRSISR